MRIYLPAALSDLSGFPTSTLAPTVAFAVTPELAAALPDEDEEAVEFSAFLAAADTAVEHLAEALSRGEEIVPRRVVITAELSPSSVRPDRGHGHPGAVVPPEVAWSDVVAAHLDEPDAAPEVEEAARGDEAAAERLAERDLLWYDPSELARLVADLS